ncbi:MAG: hypothetical protein JO262_21700 [Solirubrobacterales bacterium]|nr:hypothetical protein [Solirubrobacterales bacterium]
MQTARYGIPAPPLPEPDPEPEAVPPPPEPDMPPAVGAAPPFAPVGAPAEPPPEPLVPLEPVAPLEAPPPPAALPVAADDAPDEPEGPLDGAAAEGEPPEEDEVVVPVVEVVDVVLLTVAGEAAIVAVGTVSCGAPEVFVAAEPPPQAARPTQTAAAAALPAIRPSGARPGRALAPITANPQTSSGSMRRPQCGQSLRSFWHSWSHQLQKRRFSTDQGSSEGVGARGRSCATTSSGSPVSRSTYAFPGSASITTSRPVDGVLIRYL